MIEENPGGFRNEGKFGIIDGIPLFKTWNSRQVFLREAIAGLAEIG